MEGLRDASGPSDILSYHSINRPQKLADEISGSGLAMRSIDRVGGAVEVDSVFLMLNADDLCLPKSESILVREGALLLQDLHKQMLCWSYFKHRYRLLRHICFASISCSIYAHTTCSQMPRVVGDVT